ncbi:hypothetical protein [Pontixanthobacter luteolus]|uniref:hypothetical protein n=1 Tax=Pontixanthobacter luteolus TaxID=295089 RepID=UPI0023020C00|nr:hypothetical protein [Pontixanthobacter luteolus]
MSEKAKTIIYWMSAVVVALTSVSITGFFLTLNDFSYAVIAAPVSVIGVIAWCFAALLRWRWWLLPPLLAYVLPFLPWMEIIYG